MLLFERSKDKEIKKTDENTMQILIDKEFAIDHNKEYINYDKNELNDIIIQGIPMENHYFSSSRSTYYAKKYVYNENSKFYTASVSGGDCTNFASQTLWYGFGASDTTTSISNKYFMVSGSSYSDGWYAGSGGGSRNWESVNYFWSYMTGYKSIDTAGSRVSVVSSVSSLRNGGIMQLDFDYDGDFDHTVVMVDSDSDKFAQHTYNTYRYYDDYSGDRRFFNPNYFRDYD